VPKLSVTVITKNEAANIADALKSVAWADEIVVVDSESSDETVAIARQYTDKVIVREWPGYIAQKNHAASIASHDWIFSLDADERVSPDLAEEIKTLMKKTPGDSGFRVPRVTGYLGRWIRSTDWYPDYQLRLYDRRTAEWTGRYVHESVSVQGTIGRIRGELRHFAFRDIADHLETIDRYTTFAAAQMYETGRRANLLDLAGHPPLAFLRNYVFRLGFKDGTAGFIVSILNSYYVFLKFAKLWELSKVPGSSFRGPSSGSGTKNPEPGTRN
jgi:glycosyltransferase involved in cell wall biosynthesis